MLMETRPIKLAAHAGYGLLTAHIVYRLPDTPALLQEFIWQKEDIVPDIPRLRKFLHFWVEEIEGPIHSVTVAHALLIKPQELKVAGRTLLLH